MPRLMYHFLLEILLIHADLKIYGESSENMEQLLMFTSLLITTRKDLVVSLTYNLSMLKKLKMPWKPWIENMFAVEEWRFSLLPVIVKLLVRWGRKLIGVVLLIVEEDRLLLARVAIHDREADLTTDIRDHDISIVGVDRETEADHGIEEVLLEDLDIDEVILMSEKSVLELADLTTGPVITDLSMKILIDQKVIIKRCWF